MVRSRSQYVHGLIPRRHPVTTIPPFIGSLVRYPGTALSRLDHHSSLSFRKGRQRKRTEFERQRTTKRIGLKSLAPSTRRGVGGTIVKGVAVRYISKRLHVLAGKVWRIQAVPCNPKQNKHPHGVTDTSDAREWCARFECDR